jgi:hypothetical protein
MPFDYASLEIGQATGTDALAIMSTSLPSAVVGGAYAASVSAEGGQPAYFWSAAGLPDGLSIDSVSGEIRGIPGGAGSFEVRVTVLDSQGNLAERTLPMTVAEAEGPLVGTWLINVSVTSSRSISAPDYSRTAEVTGQYVIRLEANADQTFSSTVLSTAGSGAQVTTSSGTTRTEQSCGVPEKSVHASVNGSSIGVGGQVSLETVHETTQGFNCSNFFSPRGRIVSAQFGIGVPMQAGLPGAGGPRTKTYTVDRSNRELGIVDIETLTITMSL